MKQYRTLLLGLLSLFCSMPAVQANRSARMVMLLDETFSNVTITPYGNNIDLMALLLGSTFRQRPGVAVISPRVWFHFLYRAHHFYMQSRKDNTPERELLGIMEKASLPVIEIVRKYRVQLAEWYLYQAYKNNHTKWRGYTAKNNAALILVPTEYAEKQKSVMLSRTELMEYNETSLELGVVVSEDRLFALPTIHEKEMDAIKSLAKTMAGHHQSIAQDITKVIIPKSAYSSSSSRIDWTLFISGNGQFHPWQNHSIVCGLTKPHFQKLLHQLESIGTHALYYLTCYGGGEHASTAYRETVGKKRLFDIKYPILIASFADVKIHLHTYGLRDVGGRYLPVDQIHFGKFFNALSATPSRFREALEHISFDLQKRRDRTGAAAVALLHRPGTEEFELVTAGRGGSNNKHFYLSRKVSMMHEQQSAPITIIDKEAILVAPAYISTPIVMNTKQSKTVPAFISTGESSDRNEQIAPHIHFFREINLMSDFLGENCYALFFNFEDVAHNKLFCCKRMTLTKSGFEKFLKRVGIVIPNHIKKKPELTNVVGTQRGKYVDFMFTLGDVSYRLTISDNEKLTPVKDWSTPRNKHYSKMAETRSKQVEEAIRQGHFEIDQSWVKYLWSFFG